MRKGLTLTLMTAAITMLGAQAQAMAPTISDIPSPVVSNDIEVTGAGKAGSFIYIDALDLNTLASDDNVTSAGKLLWTYTGSGTNGASNYRISGVAPINIASTSVNVTSPTTSQIINWNQDPVDLMNRTDGKPASDRLKNTVTIRNNRLLPLTGTGATPPTANGIVAADTQLVTFFCSDGTTYSSKDVWFYTENNGNDRLSGGLWKPLTGQPDKLTKFWGKASGEWDPFGYGADMKMTTKTAVSNTGICLVNQEKAKSWGALASPYPYFNLANNQVYRIRLRMVSDQPSTGKTPFWNLIVENVCNPNEIVYSGTTPTNDPKTLYLLNMGFYDEQNGANGLTTAEKQVDIYWAPPAITTQNWKNTAFTAALEKKNDPRLRFRTIDVDGTGGGENRLGSVCIKEIEIGSSSIDKVVAVGSPLVNITKFVDAKGTGADKNVVFTPLNGATAAFSDSGVTIVPSVTEGKDAKKLEYATLGPSTDGGATPGDPTGVTVFDDYPMEWKANQILRMQVDMTAPTQADTDNMWDGFCFLFLAWTNEVNCESYITSSEGCGAPQPGAAQTYTTFYNTGFGSKSTTANYKRLRWEVRFANSEALRFPINKAENSGSVKVTRVNVQQVEFK